MAQRTDFNTNSWSFHIDLMYIYIYIDTYIYIYKYQQLELSSFAEANVRCFYLEAVVRLRVDARDAPILVGASFEPYPSVLARKKQH